MCAGRPICGFTVVSKHNMVKVWVTCNLGSSVSEEFTVCFFRRLSENGGRMFLQNGIHTRMLCVCVQGHNSNASWIENEIFK